MWGPAVDEWDVRVEERVDSVRGVYVENGGVVQGM